MDWERCQGCGAPIDYSYYSGRRETIDPDGGHHICPVPPRQLGNIHECICGAQVVDEGGHRYDWPDRTAHVHRQPRQTAQVQPKVQPVPPSVRKEVRPETPETRPVRGGALLEGLLK